MPSPDWENLDDFLDGDEFAVQVTVETQAGDVLTFAGIFDDPYLDADIGEYSFDTRRPRITCKASDVAGVTRGDTALIDNRTYDVMTGAQGDGTGMAMLDLSPQP